uniref:Uncharacterized protein n=1 Tax=Sus scrofa TaxID=9823 RepID=A0A8D1DL90_PIG
ESAPADTGRGDPLRRSGPPGKLVPFAGTRPRLPQAPRPGPPRRARLWGSSLLQQLGGQLIVTSRGWARQERPRRRSLVLRRPNTWARPDGQGSAQYAGGKSNQGRNTPTPGYSELDLSTAARALLYRREEARDSGGGFETPTPCGLLGRNPELFGRRLQASRKERRGLSSLGFRFCNACDFYDGFTCLKPQKSCSKFNLFFPTACTTDHFYFYHRRTGRYFYRYSKLSCRPCEAGMSQLFHDLLRETHCCLKDKCNDVEKTLDIFKSPR